MKTGSSTHRMKLSEVFLRRKNLTTAMGNQWKFLVFVICFLRSCQVSRSVGFTIDNQLVIIANDCYTRIAIGSKLPDANIFFSVAVGSISECEDECSKQRHSCNAFAFGIGVKGNGTCALSTKMPKFEDLQSHADYDVYVRSQRSPTCEPDRLYKMGSGIVGQERRNKTRPATRFGSGLWGSTMPSSMLSSPRTAESMMPNISDEPSYQHGYTPSFDDERRISDILKNRNPTGANSPLGTDNAKIDNPLLYPNRKSTFGQRIHSDSYHGRPDFSGSPFRNPFVDLNHLNFGPPLDSDFHSYKAVTVHNGPFEIFSQPLFVYDEVPKSKSPLDLGFWTDHDSTRHRNALASHFDEHRNQGFFDNAHKNQGIVTRPKQSELIAGNYDTSSKVSGPSSSYNFGANNAKIANVGFKDTSKVRNSGLSAGFGARITEKPKSCYRRLLSGKKSLEVRRAIECGRIDECHRACDYEKLFVCEGFNYRRYGQGARGTCELTSVPYSRMDHRDFITDPQCDYYERDPNCAANAPGTRPSWWNQPSRPTQSYGPPYSINGRPDTRPYAPDLRPLNEVPRPLDHDRRPSNEIPRPLDYGHRPAPDLRPLNEIPRPLDHDRRPSTGYGLYDDHAFDRRVYPEDSFRGRQPSARPEDRFGYSGRFPPRRPAGDDFYNRNPPWAAPPKYPNRRIDHGPPHDIGTNEIGSYLPEHRNDWGSYGVYGGSYGYDTNYVGKFDVRQYHPKSQPKPPYESDHFYGEFYNYGGAFGYGDSYIPADQDPLYGGGGRIEECSVRAGAGFRLSRGVVRKTYLTPNLDQCESLCITEKSFICMSFSYRYNVAPTDPTDNCLLSNVSYKDLNFYNDLEPDRDYDIYARIADSRICGTKRESSTHLPDECFWRVRSGFGMPEDVVRKSMTVDNLGECQVECTIAQDFTCRSFAFKYRLDQERSDVLTNCYLSDWPSQDINPANMPDMDGAELYERGSYGRGCEPYVPFFNMGRFDGKSSQENDACYSGYTKPCKLTPYAVLLATYVNSEQDCRQKCSRMRETDSIPCMSYSYKLTTHGTEENCLLSDVPIRDLRPGLDYIYDNNHVLFAWKDVDPHCVIPSYSVDDDHVFGPGPVRPLLPGPSRPDFIPGGANYPGVRPESIYPDPRPLLPRPGGHHGVRPYDPDRPDSVGPYRPGGEYGGDKFGYGNRPGGFDHGFGTYPGGYSTFRYYTVNGYPCKKGTKCERNKVAGFWTCETEGGEYGSWDYCCAPTHNCGFSQGYRYLWCYVGSSEDQWRPCSEKYFPYLPSPRPIRPLIGDDRHDRPRDPDYYTGRHWPITYLHREPPPNCTDSLASADNSGNRRTNETTPRSTAEAGTTTIKSDESNTTIATRTRRRRLRVRTASDTRNNRYTQKIDSEIAANNVRNTQTNRTAKIERITKPKSSELFAALPVAPFTAKNNITVGVLKNGRNIDNHMIRVPLIALNSSLPETRA